MSMIVGSYNSHKNSRSTLTKHGLMVEYKEFIIHFSETLMQCVIDACILYVMLVIFVNSNF